jgi:hypothetical protein
MDKDVIAAVRVIGEALDRDELESVSELWFTLATLTSYAQRRELALDRAVSRPIEAIEALEDGEAWYQRLAPSVQWRGSERARLLRLRVN